MERIKECLKNNIFVQAVLGNLVILIVFLIVMEPYLENEADIIMQEIAYGETLTGISSSAVLFSHYLMGAAIAGLHAALPIIPWYFVIHYILCFLGMSCITYLTLKRSISWENRLLTIAVMAYIGYECYALPGYVKTAAVLAIACVYVLLYVMTCIDGDYNREDKTGKPEKTGRQRLIWYASAALLGVLSSLVSFFLFIGIAGLCTILAVTGLIIIKPYGDKKLMLKSVGMAAAVLLGTAVIAAGAYYLDRLYYFKDPTLTASIAYRLGYEKCLSYGVPYFKYRTDELDLARDAIHRLGALDPALVDTNERLIYMAGATLIPSLHEIYNFIKFEKENVSNVAFIYLYGFLSYFLIRYAGKKGRRIAIMHIIIGVIVLFVMRQFLILGYYRMYTIQIMPLVIFLMPFFAETDYKLAEMKERKKSMIMLAFDMLLVVYLAYYIGDGFPVRWSKEPVVHEAEMLYYEANMEGDT
ncbi:MAG: hypothetical protein IJT96_11070 [Lachnospiraceae bacterium]|nr:hypothetical protein [Lachnospiraceae bacterium]